MIQLLLFIAVAAGLLILVVLVLRRPAVPAEGSAGALVEAKRTLDSLQLDLLPHEVVDRMFGSRDLAYVKSLGSQDLSDLFVAERKRLALAWIVSVQRQVAVLREFHVSRARMFTQMSRLKEVSVALEFVVVDFRCHALRMLIRWRGAYAAPNLVRRTATTAGRVCAVVDQSLSFLTPRLSSPHATETGRDESLV